MPRGAAERGRVAIPAATAPSAAPRLRVRAGRPGNVDAATGGADLVAFEFECPYCGWTGTQPTLDAHLNPWCPKCGKPAEFAELLRMRRERSR